MSKNRVMITAVAVWAMLLAASFAFFLWLNNATGQMDWQTYQALRESKAKEIRDNKAKERASKTYPAE